MTSEMGLLRILGSRRARIAFNVVSAVVAVGVGLFTARHFMNHGWPLGHADVVGVVAAAALFLGPHRSKAWACRRLFPHQCRPTTMPLPAAAGAPPPPRAPLPRACARCPPPLAV